MKPMMLFHTTKELIKAYRDSKIIYKELVEKVSESNVPFRCTLYRGDCIYQKFLVAGEIINFYNPLSSWSSDFEIAKSFSNLRSIPEWYFMEDEWYSEGPYPFKDLDRGTLKPVIFELNEKGITGIRVADYIDVSSDKEYVNGDEKEYILSVNKFKIESIINSGDNLRVLLSTIN